MLKSYFAIRRHLMIVVLGLAAMEAASGLFFASMHLDDVSGPGLSVQESLVAPLCVTGFLFFVCLVVAIPDFALQPRKWQWCGYELTFCAISTGALLAYIATIASLLYALGLHGAPLTWAETTLGLAASVFITCHVLFVRARDRRGNSYTSICPAMWLWPTLYAASCAGMTAFQYFLPWPWWWACIAAQAVLALPVLVGRQYIPEKKHPRARGKACKKKS
jgi:hypothetical protein